MESTQLDFGPTLVQYFLIMFPSIPFGTIMNILCHYILKYIICFFVLIVQGLKLKDCINLRRDFELLNKFETVIRYEGF